MSQTRLSAVVLVSACLLTAPVGAQRGRPTTSLPAAPVDHDLQVTLDPASGRIAVIDHVTLPPTGKPPVEFLLNARLSIAKATPAVVEVPLGDARKFVESNAPGEALLAGFAHAKRYRVRGTASARVLTVEYSGTITAPLSEQKEEYTRGFRETSGLITNEGVYLAGSSVWYPLFDRGLVRFKAAVKSPDGWQVISQGSGTSRDANGLAHWNSRDAMDEIYLVGGPLVVSRQPGQAETLVYLHKQDDKLAGSYLSAGARYIKMYSDLLGAYPYDKFALIENFWETGYGMPSFTLLGPEVIRFPFIINTSYPHEILHNWWGNSVFVDYASGNWCEGLTAYLADHLMQEQQAKGQEYRRGTLQKYRDYVKEGRDFPLTQFRARESAATEAVGYGKSLMVFHMLRRSLGDEKFAAMLRQMYGEYRGKKASWKDVQRVAEAAAGQPLAWFFGEWLSKPGAPMLATEKVSVTSRDGKYYVSGVLRQTQAGTPYQLVVPVMVQSNSRVARKDVRLDGPSAEFQIECVETPWALHVDPWFDVFRLLDPRETPPSVGQIFGEPRILAVVPASAPAEVQAAYRALLKGWQTESHAIEVKLDTDISQLPADRSIWLLGRDNRLAAPLFSKAAGISMSGDGAVRMDGNAWSLADRSSVMVMRHPGNVEKAIGWIVAEPVGALPALGRKLPHYGKYSYLGFEGADATNKLSGQWRQLDSPMLIDLRPASARTMPIPPLPPDPARPLIK